MTQPKRKTRRKLEVIGWGAGRGTILIRFVAPQKRGKKGKRK